MHLVEIQNVKKMFGQMTILRDICLNIEDGEFVVLIGPSGCGKSTLLRIIAGLEELSGGDIRIRGRSMVDVSAKDRDIAMVFQNYALYPHMTVRENMSFALTLKKAPQSEITERVDNAAEILGITPLLDRYPRQLSGGQRQRVAMGRAIVRDPAVFLFDEPLSNLDAQLRVTMRTEIRRLHQRLGTTMIYVTHDQIEAMTMADRIVVMNGGNIEQVGTPLELYDRPANRFVAGFIGSPGMNFLEGRIKIGARPTFVGKQGVELPLPAGALQDIGDGRPVVYGIRPEHLALDPAGETMAEVSIVEPTGAETQIFANVGGHEILALARERTQIKPGDRVRFSPVAAAAHLFDAGSGLRIT